MIAKMKNNWLIMTGAKRAKAARRVRANLFCFLMLAIVLTVIIASNGIVITCVKYTLASIGKRIAIILASEGDWSHWMTWGVFKSCELYKEQLIASNDIAATLNNLALTSLGKVLQVVIILVCDTVFFATLSYAERSLSGFFQALQVVYLLSHRESNYYKKQLQQFRGEMKSCEFSSRDLQNERLYPVFKNEAVIIRLLDAKLERENRQRRA